MIVNFSRTVPVLFGTGASMRTGLKAKELGVNKVMCVYDSGIKKAGIADKIINNLQSAGLNVVTYEGVKEDTPDTIVNEAAELGNAEQVEGIVCVGGGSSMDTAKAVNVLLNNPPPINKYYAGDGGKHDPGKVLILLPTTAGTGSEVTSVSVVSDTATGSKKGVMGPAATATQAIVDPELLLGLPANTTAITGMDALSHAVEALTSKGMNPMSDVLAEKAITLIVENISNSVKNGQDLEARNNMAFASLIAGIAFNDALPHWGHAIAHAVGGQFHVPHGVGCAAALPAAVEYVADAVPAKIRKIAAAMRISSVEELPPPELGAKVGEAIRELSREIGVPRLQEFGIEESALGKVVPVVLEDDCAMFGPKLASSTQVLWMLKKAYEY